MNLILKTNNLQGCTNLVILALRARNSSDEETDSSFDNTKDENSTNNVEMRNLSNNEETKIHLTARKQNTHLAMRRLELDQQ